MWQTILGYAILLVWLYMAGCLVVEGVAGRMTLRDGEVTEGMVVARSIPFYAQGRCGVVWGCVWAEYRRSGQIVRGVGLVSRQFYDSVSVGDLICIRYLRPPQAGGSRMPWPRRLVYDDDASSDARGYGGLLAIGVGAGIVGLLVLVTLLTGVASIGGA